MPVGRIISGGYTLMLENIADIVANQLGCDKDNVTGDSLLLEDLSADSLDLVEILLAIEEQYGVVVPDEDIPNFKTVMDIVSYVETNM